MVSYAGRSVQVTVNDRGPYSGGRDLDLSQGAAEYLGLTSAGVDWVDYTVVGSGGYTADSTGHSDDSGGQSYASDQPDTGSGTYVVQSGDNLSGIAAQLGTSVDDLASANGISNPDFLSVGQTLHY
jgi:rare lipoprotein A